MFNMPDGIFELGINDRHLQECEDQDEGKLCICDELIEKWDHMVLEASLYSKEVNDVILEGIKL